MPRIPRTKTPEAPAEVEAPSPWLMMMEARAPWELAALMAVSPWLRKMPAGDGHPVIVFPGLGANDLSTVTIRNFLQGQGYTPYRWQLGFNFGPRPGVLERIHALIEEVHQRHEAKVSLVGWSLGGIYAREMAKELPDKVRCVV